MFSVRLVHVGTSSTENVERPLCGVSDVRLNAPRSWQQGGSATYAGSSTMLSMITRQSGRLERNVRP